MPAFDSVGGRNAMPSGLSCQNLVRAIVSLFRPSRASFDSACERGRFISLSLAAFHIEFFVRFSLLDVFSELFFEFLPDCL
jgi:hypothetical protein